MTVNYATHVSLRRRIGNVELDSVLIGAGLFCFLASVFFGGLMPMANAVKHVSIAVIDAVALLRLFHRNVRISLLPACCILMCFLCYIIANRGTSLIGGYGRSWLVLFCLCLIAAILLRNDTVDWISIGAKFVAVFGLIHAVATITFFVIPDLYSGWFKPHFYAGVFTARDYKAGLSNHYSTNGMYLAWGLITSFYFGQVADRRGGRKWKVAVVVILVGILLTTKRLHLVVGIGACLVIYLLFNVGKGSFGAAFKVAVVAAVALVVFYLVSISVPEIAGVIDRLQDLELDDGRSSYYGICLNLFQSSPIFGHGWESFSTALYQSGVSDLARLYRNGNLHQTAHSVYYQLLAEEGIIGFVLFFGFAFTALIFTTKVALENARNGRVGLYALAVGVQVFFLWYSFTGGTLYECIEYSVYLIIGTSLSLSRSTRVGKDKALCARC